MTRVQLSRGIASENMKRAELKRGQKVTAEEHKNGRLKMRASLDSTEIPQKINF